MEKILNNPDVERILADINHAIYVENQLHEKNIEIENARHKQRVNDLYNFEKMLHNPNYEKKIKDDKAEESSNN